MSITYVSAQTKLKDATTSGSVIPNANAILELESNNKGLIFPRVSLTNTTSASPMSQHVQGLVVYNTAVANDVVAGLYMNDGTKWNLIDVAPDLNLYNGNSSITSDRTVTMDGSYLHFVGTSQRLRINSAGTVSINTEGASTRSAFGLHVNSIANLWLFADLNNSTQVVTGGSATALVLGTAAAANPVPIIFSTTNGSNQAGTDKARIEGDGRFTIHNNLGVGYPTSTTFTGNERLKVNGSIVTTSATYPDYVFDHYINGQSNLKKDYQFYSIYDTEKFIRNFKHLPGIKPIHELEKTEDGNYLFNATDLSIQSLEKIEELYLHTIEQQKQIDDLKKQVEELKKLILKTSERTASN